MLVFKANRCAAGGDTVAEIKIPRYPKEKYDDMAMPNDDVSDVYYSGLHSHLVKTLKDTFCCYCGAPIHKGDYSLSEKGFLDHRPYLIHYCMDCVDDVIDGWEGKIDYPETGYANWEKRYNKYWRNTRAVKRDG